MQKFSFYGEKKQSQFAGLRPEIRNSKFEMLNNIQLTKKSKFSIDYLQDLLKTSSI